jgi:molybdenum cofactor cytidylyltransferase
MLNIEALILAAGEARRFGRPKQLLPWGDGRTILSHVIEAAKAAPGINAINVVLGAWFTEITTTLAAELQSVNVIRNPEWQVGMFSSLKAGLNEIANRGKTSADARSVDTRNVDGIIILLGDMPFITTETLNRFVNTISLSDSRPLIATEAGRPAHPYLIRPVHIGEILSLSGESGIRPFIQKEFPGAQKIAVEKSVGRRDIDTWPGYFENRPPDSGAVIPPPPDND